MLSLLASRLKPTPVANFTDQPFVAGKAAAAHLSKGGALSGLCHANKRAEVCDFMSRFRKQDPSTLVVGDVIMSFSHLETSQPNEPDTGGRTLWDIEPVLLSEACTLEVRSVTMEMVACRKIAQTPGYADIEGKFSATNKPSFRLADLMSGPNAGETSNVLTVNPSSDVGALLASWSAALDTSLSSVGAGLLPSPSALTLGLNSAGATVPSQGESSEHRHSE